MLLLDTNFLIDLHTELRRKPGVDGPAKRFMRANRTLAMAITPVTANEYAAASGMSGRRGGFCGVFE